MIGVATSLQCSASEKRSTGRCLVTATLSALLCGCMTAQVTNTRSIDAEQPAKCPIRQVAGLSTEPEPLGENFGSWGFDVTGMNRSIDPGDSFYDYANGNWQDRTTLPADRPYHTMYTIVNERLRSRFKRLFEDHERADPELGRVRTLYRSYMDLQRLEDRGLSPLEPELTRIRRIHSLDDFAAEMGRQHASLGESPLRLFIEPDADEPTRHSLHLEQAGLGLDRAYYIDREFASKLDAYRGYVGRQLAAAGWQRPDLAAEDVVALERKLAALHWTAKQRTDSKALYNPRSLTQLATTRSEFPWRTFLRGAGVDGADRIIVLEPSAVDGIARTLARTPLSTLKAWMAFHLIDATSPYLPKKFRAAQFEFREMKLKGAQAAPERWRGSIDAIGAVLPGSLSRAYAHRYLDERAQLRVRTIAEQVRRALEARIHSNTWMDPSTRQMALTKLAAMQVEVGFPTKLPDESSLQISEGHLYENMQSGALERWRRSVADLREPVDKQRWPFPPFAVGAVHLFPKNEVIFPAGFLQTPFFNPDADDAVNYGAIGALIGHEMGHAFDSMGRQYDASGRLRDWWQADDALEFEKRTAQLADQIGKLEYAPGKFVDGQRTLVENTADVLGLTAAVDAYKSSASECDARPINGFNGTQRVFLAYAQMYRAKFSPELQESIAATDYHAPARLRVDGIVRNVDAWYDSFSISPTSKLYLKPSERAAVW